MTASSVCLRYVIDGKKAIQLREDDDKLEACVFEQYEVYSVDVVMSSGEGRPRPTDLRTTVFKRQVDQKYGLKVKASRVFFNEVSIHLSDCPSVRLSVRLSVCLSVCFLVFLSLASLEM